MADEAFALSPIGARATQPGEADYEAIREAFMETARGRWFLGEYAKRNRNADTSMVLDAVARIEETLAAQRPPELDDRLPEALAAIRSAVDDAAQVASTAIDGLGLDDSLAPIRKGARIVKEISWRWREIGADSRICDLIDSQVSAIEGSCGQISELDPRPAVNGAFDLIRTRIDAFSEEDAKEDAKNADPDDEKTVPPAADEVMETAIPAAAEPVARVIEVVPEVAAAGSADTGHAESKLPQDTLPQETLPQDAPMTSAIAVVEVAGDVAATADARNETFLDETVLDEAVLGEVVLEDAVLDQTGPDQTVLDVTASDQAVLAEAVVDEAGLDEAGLDEAVLDMVALAMAAPDPAGEIDYSIADPDEIIEAPRPAAAIAAVMPEAAAPPMQIAVAQAAPPPQSIGSALLANGFLEQHRTPANDPLAPIRRMSQAEKIAFFS